jgi:hypothetical protein
MAARALRHALSRALLAVVVATLAAPTKAHAELGGDESSVTTDRAHMQAALLRINRSSGFAVHEMQSATGTLVREYVSSSGRVFAVAWQGPWIPDLQQLLGAYFTRYQEAAARERQVRRGRGPLSVQTPDFVVETSGRPRAFTGRAFLPDQIPSGVQTDTLR